MFISFIIILHCLKFSSPLLDTSLPTFHHFFFSFASIPSKEEMLQEQTPGFGPTILPPTCLAAAALFNFPPRVWRLGISGEDIEELCCKVSAMMVTARGGKTTINNLLHTATRSLCLGLSLPDPRPSISAAGWRPWRRPEGVEKSARVLTCRFSGSRHFPYWSGCRVEASDLARITYHQTLT